MMDAPSMEAMSIFMIVDPATAATPPQDGHITPEQWSTQKKQPVEEASANTPTLPQPQQSDQDAKISQQLMDESK